MVRQQIINERNELLKVDARLLPHFDTEKALDLFDKLLPGLKISIITEEIGEKETDSYLISIGIKEYMVPVNDIKTASDVRAAIKRMEAGLLL